MSLTAACPLYALRAIAASAAAVQIFLGSRVGSRADGKSSEWQNACFVEGDPRVAAARHPVRQHGRLVGHANRVRCPPRRRTNCMGSHPWEELHHREFGWIIKSRIWGGHHALDLPPDRQCCFPLYCRVQRGRRIAGSDWLIGMANVQGSRIWNSRGISSKDLRGGRGTEKGMGRRFESDDGRALLSITRENEDNDNSRSSITNGSLALSLRSPWSGRGPFTTVDVIFRALLAAPYIVSIWSTPRTKSEIGTLW